MKFNSYFLAIIIGLFNSKDSQYFIDDLTTWDSNATITLNKQNILILWSFLLNKIMFDNFSKLSLAKNHWPTRIESWRVKTLIMPVLFNKDNWPKSLNCGPVIEILTQHIYYIEQCIDLKLHVVWQLYRLSSLNPWKGRYI